MGAFTDKIIKKRRPEIALSQEPPHGPMHVFVTFEEAGYLEYLRGGPTIIMPPAKYWHDFYIDPDPKTPEIRRLRDLITTHAETSEIDAHMRSIGIRVGFPRLPPGQDAYIIGPV